MRSSAAGTTELLLLALTLNLPSCHVFLSALLSYSLFKGAVTVTEVVIRLLRYLSRGVYPRVQAAGHGVDGGVVRVDPEGLHPSPHPDVALERVRVFPSPPLGVPPADYLCRCHRCQKLAQFQRINQASSTILESIENRPIYLTKRQKKFSTALFIRSVAMFCYGCR